MMPKKRSATFHEKRVLYFTVLFGALQVLFVVALLLLVNRSLFWGR